MAGTFPAASGRLGRTNFRGDSVQKEHRVGIVLDESFGRPLMLLAQRIHVWAVESRANTRAAKDFLALDVSLSDDPLESGVTTFVPQGNSRSENLTGVLEDVDEHHGEYAHTPPWTVLEIYGLDEADVDKARLGEYGVTNLKRTEFRLEARRVV